MRITSSITDRNFLANVESLSERLEQSNMQMSTGKKLIRLSDSPSNSAQLVGLRDQLAEVDQYKVNSDNSSYLIGLTDSVLDSVHNLVTAIFTNGSAAASSSVDAAGRAAQAEEVRALRDQVLALSNTEAQGRFIFAGSRVTTQTFSISGDTVTYHGDAEVNTISVGDHLQVRAGVSGDVTFTPVFAAVNQLLAAMDANDLASIQTALSGFRAVLSGIEQFRGQLGNDLSRLQGIQTSQEQQKTGLMARQSSLEDANMAQVITQMSQLQTAVNATLTAHSSTERRTLFDFLG